MRTKIAVIGANYQYLSFYRQTKALGYEIFSFARAKDDHPCWDLSDHYYDLAFKDKEKILEICKENRVQGVTSFLLESALPVVYYVAEGLGSPCNSKECQEITANKYTMREQMRKRHLSIPAYKAIHSKDEDVNDIPFPVIVKPADSGGSRGVSLVRNQEELDFALSSAFDFSPNQMVLIEQFIDGREFSIESITCQGKHYILQITDKVTTGAPHFVEVEHHQPAQLTSKQKNDIENLVLNMLDALKIENSAGHTEVKMDADGIPYIIEMGPRMGGGYTASDLVRLSTGYDFVKGMLEVATGQQFEIPVSSEQKCAGVYFLTNDTQQKVLPFIERHNEYPFIVYADIWDNIRPVTCNSDRVGCFIYQSDKKIELEG